jgi:hypothetical protein
VTRFALLAAALASLLATVPGARSAGFDPATFFARGDPAVRARPGAGGPVLPSTALACARCHGSDGRGGREGGIEVPSVVWRTLSLPTRHRPGYDIEALAVALAQGRDPAGHALHPVMPRFELDRGQVEALARFLEQLDRPPVAGVADETVRLGLLLPEPERHPAADRIRAVARSLVEGWNRAGGFWGRRVQLVELAGGRPPRDVFALVLRMLPVPAGLEGVPDLFPLLRDDAPSPLSLLPSEAEVDRLLEERARLLAEHGSGPVRIVRSPAELSEALAEGADGFLLGELDRLAGVIAELPRGRALVLELLDVHPFTDPAAGDARRFAALARSLGLDPERAGLARLAFASLLFLEDAFEAAGRSLDRGRFVATLRNLPPRATGLLPAMRPGEPVPLARLSVWRLAYPEGRVERQPAAQLAASSTSR